jgi:hypothetical protein
MPRRSKTSCTTSITWRKSPGSRGEGGSAVSEAMAWRLCRYLGPSPKITQSTETPYLFDISTNHLGGIDSLLRAEATEECFISNVLARSMSVLAPQASLIRSNCAEKLNEAGDISFSCFWRSIWLAFLIVQVAWSIDIFLTNVEITIIKSVNLFTPNINSMDRRKAIKKWLIDQGLSLTDIARAAGVSTSYTSLTISGSRHSRQVWEVLSQLGCPFVTSESKTVKGA